MPLLPNNQPQLLASDIIKRTDQLVARDNEDGGLKDSTKIGIAIGLICFFGLTISFWFIWRLHWSRRTQPNEWDNFRDETLNRWMDNVGGPSRSNNTRNSTGNRTSRRDSASTMSTLTNQKQPFHQMGYELESPIIITSPKPVHHDSQ